MATVGSGFGATGAGSETGGDDGAGDAVSTGTFGWGGGGGVDSGVGGWLEF